MLSKIISQRDTKYANNGSFQGGLTDVIVALKNNIFRTLNVASIGEVTNVNSSSNTVEVKLLPQLSNEQSKTVTCNCILFPTSIQAEVEDKDGNKQTITQIQWTSYCKELATHDIVLVIYTNRSSSQNITQSNNDAKYSLLMSNNVELHSDKFGVVVGIITKRGTNKGDTK